MPVTPVVFNLIPRQSDLLNNTDVPSCVTQCMGGADITGCASNTDFACLCLSATYSNSVALCWIGKCTSDDITVGMRYTGDICSAVAGGNSTMSDGSMGNSNSTTNGTIGDTPIPITTGQPHIFQSAFLNVQAIMSSICAAVLLAAIVLGFLSCRSRLRAEKEAVERSTWSGVATYAETKGGAGGKSQILSQNGASSRAFDPTATAFSTFSAHAPPIGGSINRPWPAATGLGGSINRPGHSGFTNRLSFTEPVPEEIEMSVQRSPDSPSGSSLGKEKAVSFDEAESMVESPTSAVTRMGDSAYGSTVELTPKPKQVGFSSGTVI